MQRTVLQVKQMASVKALRHRKRQLSHIVEIKAARLRCDDEDRRVKQHGPSTLLGD